MQKRGPLAGIAAQNNPTFIALIFILLAFLTAMGLDFIAKQKGGKSYIFGAFKEKKRVSRSEGILDQVVRKNLSESGIPPDSIDQYQDSGGALHLLIDLSLKKYKELEYRLEEEFRNEKAAVEKKEEQETAERNFYLWEIKGEKEEKLILLFSCLKEKPPEEEKAVLEEEKNKVAIIIDDMGYSLRAIEEITAIGKPLTTAVLPFSPLAKETAQIAHQNGLEVILHLPLESINSQGHNNWAEGMIHSEMNKEEIIEAVDKGLEQVPYAIGVNNHMGSKITANEILMKIILERLKERNLFFIDSRTTNHSVAYKTAQSLGIPSAYRKVFLDTENDEDIIRRKLIELFLTAQKEGWALGICHPTAETLKVLKENFHLVDKYDLEPVFASQIVK